MVVALAPTDALGRLYLFEAIAVIAFGVAWLTAGLTGVRTDQPSHRDDVPELANTG